jgi:hypothetical protein
VLSTLFGRTLTAHSPASRAAATDRPLFAFLEVDCTCVAESRERDDTTLDQLGTHRAKMSDPNRDKWECGACTFFNKRGLTKCEMCNTNKGSSSRKSSADKAFRQEQEVELARLQKKPKIVSPPEQMRQTKPGSKARHVDTEEGYIVKHSIQENGKSVTIFGNRSAPPGFGVNVGTSHIDTGKRGKKRAM